jgi:hypothetical protein
MRISTINRMPKPARLAVGKLNLHNRAHAVAYAIRNGAI